MSEQSATVGSIAPLTRAAKRRKFSALEQLKTSTLKAWASELVAEDRKIAEIRTAREKVLETLKRKKERVKMLETEAQELEEEEEQRREDIERARKERIDWEVKWEVVHDRSSGEKRTLQMALKEAMEKVDELVEDRMESCW
jgi:septal ring factor EnvC (AmiA/AmiB activator)